MSQPRGRKPKPTALKVLEGNPGHRPLNEREPKPPVKALACPKDLSKEGKKEWRRLCRELEQEGVLTNWDMRIFEQYCDAYAKWKEATNFLNERGLFYITPSGYPQQFPQVAIAQKYSVLMHKYAQELGLTPAARSRLIAGKESGSGDEMEDLLNE